ncbi:hypothetical protein NP233_g8907 [Leucocoprinus birnbaumii]|uniref:F-box domain-containing protein n=1 Tax=Leucocoprinus birnbaumii TaxID=56174 RepID=A0AAD5VM37_9AGAR|nr:hypothetical protein NP233_g8907 [Leucocoprinus birnbaumii]
MPSLPVELQAIVVRSLTDDDDLHLLAQVSRDLNFLVVEELCSIYGLDPRSGTLTLDARTFRTISTLAISVALFGASLQLLNCDLTNAQELPELMKQTRSLRNFISSLQSVQWSTLYFPSNGAKEWEEAMASVCNTLADKRCAGLHIKTLARSTTPPVRTNKLATLIQKLSLPVVGKKRTSRVARPSNHLESCHLQTLPTFLQPLLAYRLNTSHLTTLTFRYIYNFSEWDDFITTLYLPLLKNFTVSHCIIPGQAFSDFLNRHPKIASLDFHHNTYLRHNPPALPSGILPRLQRLRTSSEYLVRYFPPLESFTSLATIILPAGDMVRDSHRAVLALQALIPCTNDITLCLEFTYVHCLDNWLRDTLIRSQQPASANHLGETDPTRRLRCVKALELDSKLIAYSSDGVVQLLVRWLCMFPELTKVFITRPCLPLVFGREEFEGFAKEVQRASASMEVISVESDDASVWTWCSFICLTPLFSPLQFQIWLTCLPTRSFGMVHNHTIQELAEYTAIQNSYKRIAEIRRECGRKEIILRSRLNCVQAQMRHLPSETLAIILEYALAPAQDLERRDRRYKWSEAHTPNITYQRASTNALLFSCLFVPENGFAIEESSNLLGDRPPSKAALVDAQFVSGYDHSLRRLILKNVETIGPLPVIAQNITAIDLCAVSFPHCIHLELTCTNLVEFRCRFIPYAPGIGDIPMGPEIVLHHLQVLVWPYRAHSTCLRLGVLHAPKLREPGFIGPFHYNNNSSALRLFLSRVSFTATRLKFVAFKIEPEETFDRILHFLPNIQSITLESRSFFTLIPFFEAVLDLRDEMDSARHFEIEPADEDTHSDRPSWSFLLVDCVTARWNTPLRQWPAGLHISIQDVPLRYRLQHIEYLRRCISDGLDLVINHYCNIDLMYYLRSPQIKIGDDLDKDCMFTESNRNEYI